MTSSPCSAQQKERSLFDEGKYTQYTEQLYLSTVVYPQEKGTFQITSLPQYQRGPAENITLTPVFLSYGINNNLQVGVGWEVFNHYDFQEAPNRQGLGDWAVGLQYSVMHMADTQYSLAFGFNLLWPTANINKELTDGFIQYTPFVVVAKDFPERANLQIYAEAGFNFVQRLKHHANSSKDDPAAHDFIFNAGFFGPLHSFVYSMELNWQTNRWNHQGEDNELYLTPGLAWNVSKDLEIGFGMPVGLNRGASRYQLIAMLAYELG